MAKKVSKKKKKKVEYYKQIYGKSTGRKVRLKKLRQREVILVDVESGLTYKTSRTNFEKFYSKILTKKEVEERRKDQQKALGLKPLPKSFKELEPHTFEWMRYWRTFPEKQSRMVLHMKQWEKNKKQEEQEKIAMFKKKAKEEERKRKKEKKLKKKKKKLKKKKKGE